MHSEASGQESEMSDEKPSDLGGSGAFEVSGEAAASAEPRKSTFDDPASWQEFKAFDPERSLDDLDPPRTTMGERVNKLCAAINPISEDVPQFGKAVPHALQQGDRTMDILNVGGMDVNGQQQAIGIGDDVPLAPVDAFAGIEAARAASMGRCSALAVDDRSRRGRSTSKFLPRSADQSSDDPVPPARIAPGIKIALDRRVGRELARSEERRVGKECRNRWSP